MAIAIVDKLVRKVYEGDNGYEDLEGPVHEEKQSWSGRRYSYKEKPVSLDLTNIVSLDQLIEDLGDERDNCPLEELMAAYQQEICMMDMYAEQAREPSAHMVTWRHAGDQFIAEFWLNDLYKPKGDSYNWHLQNTSQWCYAGCILYDRRDHRISRHH